MWIDFCCLFLFITQIAYGLELDTEDVDEVFILGTTHHIIALKLFSKSRAPACIY